MIPNIRFSLLLSLIVGLLTGCSARPTPDVRLEKDAAGQVISATLIGRHVTDSDLKSASNHSNLTELRLQECSKVTSQGFGQFKGNLPNIKLIEIVRVPIDDKSLGAFASASALSDITLANTNVLGDGLSQLANCPIRHLIFVSRTATVEGMKSLSSLKALEELELDCQELQLKDFTALTDLKQLKKLVAYRTPVGKGGVEVLRGLSNLEYLHLNSTDVDDTCIDALNSLLNMEQLAIDSGRFSNEGLKGLKLPKLKHLSLDGCISITDEGLGNFSGMPAIESLMLGGTGVAGIDLTPLSTLPNLKEVKLLGNQFKGNEESIKALKAKLPNCEVFIMRG